MSTLRIFADESCQNTHQYMVLSGICVPQAELQVVNGAINGLRSAHRFHGELKWTKVSNGKLSSYKALADLFFHLSKRDLVNFHSVIINTHELNHKLYNDNDKEIGFSKFVYQLLLKFGRIYTANRYLECYLDKRTTKHSLDDLKHVLNNGVRARWRRPYGTYSRVHFLDSKQSNLLQMNDVLLGAVASRANGHHLKPDASAAKTMLSDHIMARAGIKTVLTDTPRSNHRFTTWNFQLQKR